MVFREASADDIPALSEIRFSVSENILSDPRKVPTEMYADYLITSGKGWLCEVDGEAVGFIVASLKDASIWALFVKPRFEGRAVGTTLLRLATGWLFDMGASSISLNTDANTRADRFYESQGWKRGETKSDGEVNYRLDRSGERSGRTTRSV